MHISLPKALEKFVETRYETGRYSSKSEIIHEGLRRLMDEDEQYRVKLDALRKAIQAGLDGGPAVDLDMDEILAEAEGASKRKE